MIEIQQPHSSEDAVDRLNGQMKLYLAPSKVHGVGVFALRSISRGEKLYADEAPTVYKLPYSYFGKLFPEVRELLLSHNPHIINGSLFIFPTERWTAYLNHSEEQNYDIQSDMALTDIKKGEEIFENYKLIKGYAQIYPFLT
jgi:SET domain-containing protein